MHNSPGVSVKYIQFDAPTSPNKAPIAKGHPINYGSYCLTNKHTLGILSKDQLEPAGIELTDINGQPTLGVWVWVREIVERAGFS